jgi:hypothetical protein
VRLFGATSMPLILASFVDANCVPAVIHARNV